MSDIKTIKEIPQSHIRNFSIIAHIDHGKSTLADRILGIAKVTNARTEKEQILDNMDLERERGITIKSNSISFIYNSQETNEKYLFNLIDTPGHVDFNYEVSRSLAACEGAILVIDSTQGIEAQTLANLYLALENNLTIIPVINKIDLPAANIPGTMDLIVDTLGLEGSQTVPLSAKTGENVQKLLDNIVEFIPPPIGKATERLQALIYDSYYDSYSGAIMKVRIIEGTLKTKDKIQLMSNQKNFAVTELGVNVLKPLPMNELHAGEVGYIIAGIKSVEDTRVGDTVSHSNNPTLSALAGYKEVKPMVYAGLFPINGADFENLQDAIAKLKLNDAALSFEQENSPVLGFGFRVGYLGLLHMDIVQERLQREFELDLISTPPSVSYKITDHKQNITYINNPALWPTNPTKVGKMEEPITKLSIITPNDYLGPILKLLQEKRGVQENIIYISETQVQILYTLPLSELIFEFYDKLKSVSRGYATLDYDLAGFQESKLVKINILINSESIDILTMIVHHSIAQRRGKELAEKLKELIPRHQFRIAIQAAIGSKIIAREDISAFRKNVTAKCYGGDISRKRKLLEKQKEGKKKMKQIGSVTIPQEAFLAVLKRD